MDVSLRYTSVSFGNCTFFRMIAHPHSAIKTVDLSYSLKGGDPAAPSDTATLL